MVPSAVLIGDSREKGSRRHQRQRNTHREPSSLEGRSNHHEGGGEGEGGVCVCVCVSLAVRLLRTPLRPQSTGELAECVHNGGVVDAAVQGNGKVRR